MWALHSSLIRHLEVLEHHLTSKDHRRTLALEQAVAACGSTLLHFSHCEAYVRSSLSVPTNSAANAFYYQLPIQLDLLLQGVRVLEYGCFLAERPAVKQSTHAHPSADYDSLSREFNAMGCVYLATPWASSESDGQLKAL